MIQFKRGSTSNWRTLDSKLADGQPGYDKNKHKIKIGDGETPWMNLPYASGLQAEEILNAEDKAKARYSLDPEDITLITYGTEDPDEDTVGQLYLQHYDATPEVDYVVSYGISGIWTYRKWASGIAECWGTCEISSPIKEAFEGEAIFYNSELMTRITYPFAFKDIPNEQASLQSQAYVVWLAGRKVNTTKQSGLYRILSPLKRESATYRIILNVKGRWK